MSEGKAWIIYIVIYFAVPILVAMDVLHLGDGRHVFWSGYVAGTAITIIGLMVHQNFADKRRNSRDSEKTDIHE